MSAKNPGPGARSIPRGPGVISGTKSSWAIARIFLLTQMGIVLVVCTVVGVLLYWQIQDAARDQASEITRAESATLARDPFVVEQIQSGTPTERLQPYVRDILANSSVSFITIMSPEGIRFTHPNDGLIGEHYMGDISRAQRGETMTVEEKGSLGVSMRTITPVRNGQGEIIGLVSTGVTVSEISEVAHNGLPAVAVIAGLLLVATTITTLMLYRYLNRATLGYSRDDILKSEATRSMAALLRTQNHEHRNRMHTVLSLLDLERIDEAHKFAREDLESSEHKAYQWNSYEQLPAVTALLAGKKSEAGERCIDLTTRVAGDWARVPLSEIELVSVVSNLIDNAMDAVGAMPGPREVEIEMSETDDGWQIVVADSGPGVRAGTENTVFEWGYTTKPTGPEGRGIGLALVHETLVRHGGSISAMNDAGAVFTVHIPKTLNGSHQ
ncbi:sensor histidine kinase [Rothia uropygialis]|uniref:sensor histidine kinase n=1 Tax=Kocuria sp. 36 TaxID=1415402 RepID=UPI00101BE553|nr:ATP-binding protein [Kocuria sp. 36]